MIRYIESGLIYRFKPTKNKLNRMNYSGPKFKISNTLKSYGGLDIHRLLLDKRVASIDSLSFSDLSLHFIDNYFKGGPDKFHQGMMQLLGRIDLDIFYLNEDVIVS